MRFRLTPPRPAPRSEAEVIKECIGYLGRRGYWCHRNPVGRFQSMTGHWAEFGPPGIPDYTAIHGSYPAFFVEFKRPGKKLRETQAARFHELELYGFATVMAASVEDLIDFLDGHEERARTRLIIATAMARGP